MLGLTNERATGPGGSPAAGRRRWRRGGVVPTGRSRGWQPATARESAPLEAAGEERRQQGWGLRSAEELKRKQALP